MSLEITAEFGTEEFAEELHRKTVESDHVFYLSTFFEEFLGADPQYLKGRGCRSIGAFLVDSDDGPHVVEIKNINSTSDQVKGVGVPSYVPVATRRGDSVFIDDAELVDDADEALEMIADGLEMVVKVYTVDRADEPCCGSCPDDAGIYHRDELVEERTISDIQASAEFLAENGEQVNHGHMHSYNTLA